ncbi:MAG: hypothetical protein QNJ48_00880 [Desulfobacterales bacterium]|nr:hypothetical protein [Desulfobacterales bacterium]MDJ0882677.1 hypothetical protein [Desulfobacterales bacterium]
MKMPIIRNAVLLFSLVLSAAPLWAQGGESPGKAYRQYIDALFRADPDQALAVIAGRAEQIDFIRTFITCLGASNAFRIKYIAAYGQSEWDKFSQDEPAYGVRAFNLPDTIPLNTYRALLNKQPAPSGRGYIVSQENGNMRIIQQGGRWYLKAGTLGFEGRSSQYKILTAVLREYQTRIGASQETPAGLRVAMKRALRRTGQW